ncbi:MAG: YciI family protein [Acidimicrobiia bacterium]
MSQYLLSVHAVEGQAQPQPTPEQMQEFMQRVRDLETEMDESGTFVFGGHLHGPDASTVVAHGDSGVVMTDGPFVESKEHIAGFYIINADDLDDALVWAGKVTAAVGKSIEVRPFVATGRVPG